MTVKAVMELGTKGMNTAQKQEEKERRIAVVEKINKIGMKIKRSEDKKEIRKYNRELSRIKAEESIWLKEAAWFLYA